MMDTKQKQHDIRWLAQYAKHIKYVANHLDQYTKHLELITKHL